MQPRNFWIERRGRRDDLAVLPERLGLTGRIVRFLTCGGIPTTDVAGCGSVSSRGFAAMEPLRYVDRPAA
jgi:hypothetical protein